MKFIENGGFKLIEILVITLPKVPRKAAKGSA